MSGVVSLFFWTYLLYFLGRCARNDILSGIYFVCMVPLLVFNDRFINLNPYPLLYYFGIVSFGSTVRRRQ
jgi:hypothetical protein